MGVLGKLPTRCLQRAGSDPQAVAARVVVRMPGRAAVAVGRGTRRAAGA